MYLCAVFVIVGALILRRSIIQYYHVLVYMKSQVYERKVFKNWIYIALFIMMIFFLIGYICVAVMLILDIFEYDLLLIAMIFLFEAIFVSCVVSIQKIMTEAIVNKTLETIQSMIESIEAKDIYTKGHSDHVYKLAELFYSYLPEEIKCRVDLVKLKDAAMLHDIGKIGIPDGILNKPDKLTEEEWKIIKQHPQNGKIILEKTTYREICDMVLYHHERVDGKGYYNIPSGTIPIEAKIIAIADTFSALYTDRVYRKRYPFNKAMSIIREVEGTQLDPELVDIFCNIPESRINSVSTH